jgi:hypothetical protein
MAAASPNDASAGKSLRWNRIIVVREGKFVKDIRQIADAVDPCN